MLQRGRYLLALGLVWSKMGYRSGVIREMLANATRSTVLTETRRLTFGSGSRGTLRTGMSAWLHRYIPRNLACSRVHSMIYTPSSWCTALCMRIAIVRSVLQYITDNLLSFADARNCYRNGLQNKDTQNNTLRMREWNWIKVVGNWSLSK